MTVSSASLLSSSSSRFLAVISLAVRLVAKVPGLWQINKANSQLIHTIVIVRKMILKRVQTGRLAKVKYGSVICQSLSTLTEKLTSWAHGWLCLWYCSTYFTPNNSCWSLFCSVASSSWPVTSVSWPSRSLISESFLTSCWLAASYLGQGIVFFQSLKGLKRRLTDILKSIYFFTLSKIFENVIYYLDHIHLKFSRSAYMNQKHFSS